SGPEPVLNGVLAEAAQAAAHEVSAGVAAEGVTPEQEHVGEHDEVAEPDTETAVAAVEEGDEHVPGVDEDDDGGCVEEVSVAVLEQHQRPGLTGVGAVGFAYRAGRGCLPDGAVVGLAEVVAGHPEQQQDGHADQCVREKGWKVPRQVAEQGGLFGALVGQTRGVEGGQVVVFPDPVVVLLEHPDGPVDDEGGQTQCGEGGADPPSVGAQGTQGYSYTTRSGGCALCGRHRGMPPGESIRETTLGHCVHNHTPRYLGGLAEVAVKCTTFRCWGRCSGRQGRM